MSMENFRIPRSMITSPYNQMIPSSHVVTISDNSERPEPNVNADQYSVAQALFTPRGITAETIYLEGNNTLNNFKKLVGNVNTVLYGHAGTMALRAVESGFNLAFANVRPDDATYPNFYMSLMVKPFMVVPEGQTEEAQDKHNVYWYKVTGDSKPENDGYWYDVSEEALKEKLKEAGVTVEDGNIKKLADEDKLPVFEFGLFPKHITNLTHDQDLNGYLTLPAGKYAVDPVGGGEYPEGGLRKNLVYKARSEKEIEEGKAPEVGADLTMDVPLFGMAYRGASSYDNIWYANMIDRGSNIDSYYPYFGLEINDSQSKKPQHKFDFLLTTYSKGNSSYSFYDKGLAACKMIFTNTNHVQTFVPWMINRKDARRIGTDVSLVVGKLKADTIAAIKKTEADAITFDGLGDDKVKKLSQARLDIFLSGYDDLINKFTIQPEAATSETPLSRVNIFKLADYVYEKDAKTKTVKEVLISKAMPGLKIRNCAGTVRFAGGSLGSLENVIKEGDFDFETTIKKEWKRYDVIKNDFEVVKTEKKYRIWVELFKEFYTGAKDPAIFDQTIVKDCICFGENYPNDLQEVVADLVKYKENIVHCENTRPDFTYIRTHEHNFRTIGEVENWAGGFMDVTRNHNMHPVCGTFMFNDPTTKGQERFSGFYEYLGQGGTLFNYLVSGVSDSFASGDYSTLFSAVPGTALCVPRTNEERASLVGRCVMYYERDENGYLKLGDDSGYIPGYKSGLKNIGSNIQFNRMLNAASRKMIKYKITNTDPDTLDKIRKQVQEVIKQGAKHFKNKVVVTIEISSDENEIGRDVVLVTISVVSHRFSKHNRLHQIMELPEGVSADAV